MWGSCRLGFMVLSEQQQPLSSSVMSCSAHMDLIVLINSLWGNTLHHWRKVTHAHPNTDHKLACVTSSIPQLRSSESGSFKSHALNFLGVDVLSVFEVWFMFLWRLRRPPQTCIHPAEVNPGWRGGITAIEYFTDALHYGGSFLWPKAGVICFFYSGNMEFGSKASPHDPKHLLNSYKPLLSC